MKYLQPDDIHYIHDRLIAGSGGLPGESGHNGLDAICMTAETYHDDSTLEGLSAFYLSRVAKAHAFNDANKRTAYFASRYFLILNGSDFNGHNYEDAVAEVEKIASAPTMDKAYEIARGLSGKYIVSDGVTVQTLAQFDRLVLKSIAVATHLKDR